MSALLSRRDVLRRTALSTAALGLLASCGSDDGVDLRFGVLAGQDPAITPYWIAKDRGLFEKAGCRTDIMLGGPNSPPLLTLLAAGSIDMAIASWFSLADALAKGNDFVVLGANFPVNPHCLMSLPKRPIRTAQDIVGKTLLLQFPNYKDLFDAILAFNRVQGSFRTSPVGYNADTLFSGEGDGYFAFIVNGPVILESEGKRQGRDFIVAPLADMGFTVPDGLIVVRRETLQSKRAQLAAFFAAMREGFAINAADVRPGVRLLTERYLPDAGINPANQIRTASAYLKLARLPGQKPFQFGEAEIERLYTFAGLAGRNQLPPAGKLFDFSLVA